uniref:O-methyltransferase n=1 Tax=Acrobeloides nanus TaxID=290746 RepID=A0A914EAS9_9BILA
MKKIVIFLSLLYYAFGVSTVSKSFRQHSDPIISYCTRLTVKPTELEEKITNDTINNDNWFVMLGAPEVLQLGKNFIQLIGAKKALDIGTYTGASAAAWATAMPSDGKVLSMDVSHASLDSIGKPLINQYSDIEKKIDFRLGPALETLDNLINNGESGKWDFCFIDADKVNYKNYYIKCVQLLRSGGVIMVDNALWGGSVVRDQWQSLDTRIIAETNEYISQDNSTNSALINVGDGLHLAFKK